MKYHTKLLLVQNCYVLGLTKQMDLLKFEMELDIQYYLVLKEMMQFIIELGILGVKKVLLHKFLIIILQEPQLIYIILYLQKKHIKSDFNKNQNSCYFNIFLEKGSFQDKSYAHFLNECLYIISATF